jgi:inhibitor of cysteine peptidase
MKSLKLVLCLVILSVTLLGCGSSSSSSPRTVAVTQNDTGTTVYLHQNDLLTVSLQGNASTGYVWDVQSGTGSVLTQQGDVVFAADSNAIGSGGTYTFTFKATTQGTTTLNMINRPSDPTPLAQGFIVTVIVGS